MALSDSTDSDSRFSKKARTILSAAREVFLASGFEGASTDEIVRNARVSKATVYRHFSDKTALFEAVIELECQEMSRRTAAVKVGSGTLEEQLEELARDYLKFLLTPFCQRIYRIAIAESSRKPEVGRAFYKAGPELGAKLLGARLQSMEGLRIGDPDLAALQFVELCKCGGFWPVFLGVRKRVTKAEIASAAREATRMFLRGYGN